MMTLAEAELAGAVLQAALYGIFCVLFVGTLHVLVVKPKGQQTASGLMQPRKISNKFLFCVSITLFILITVHWIIQISRLFDAFIRDPQGPNLYYLDAAGTKNVVKTAFYVAQTFVGDVTIMYRLYIVWARNKIVLIPAIISTLTLLGAGTTVCWSFTQLSPTEDFFTSPSGKYIIIVFASSLFTNVYTTVMLSYRILSINRIFHHGIRSRVYRVLNIVLESAALYTVCLIVTHVTYLTKIAFQFIALDVTSPIIGISFSLIIVRVGLGISTEVQNGSSAGNGIQVSSRQGVSSLGQLNTPGSPISTHPFSGYPGYPGYGKNGFNGNRQSHIPLTPLKSLTVNVSKQVTTQIDGVDGIPINEDLSDDENFLKGIDSHQDKPWV